MLISLIERYQDKGEHEIIRYGNWSAALRHFENACEEGDIPEIADLKNFLDPIPESQQADALCDLIAAHIKQSWALGKKSKLDSYLIEFPNLGSLSELPISLIEDEFLVRYLRPHGDFPEINDYKNRFSENLEVTRLLHRRCLNDERYIKLHQIGSGATSVVWEGFDGNDREIFLYRGYGEPIQITDNDFDDFGPRINRRGDVVWAGKADNDLEIFQSQASFGGCCQ